MNHHSTDEIVAALSALASSYNLHARALEGCRMCLANSAEDGPDWLGGWAVGDIEPHFRSCSLVFDNLLGYPFLDTRLDLCVRDASGVFFRDMRPIGYYRLITRLDGTDDDEYLVIDVPKPTGE